MQKHMAYMATCIYAKNFSVCENLRKCEGNILHMQRDTCNEIFLKNAVILQLINITQPIYGK